MATYRYKEVEINENKLKKLGIYLFLLVFFVVCFAISFSTCPTMKQNPYFQGTLVHLNAELEIEESSLSPFEISVDERPDLFANGEKQRLQIQSGARCLGKCEHGRQRKKGTKEQTDEKKSQKKTRAKDKKEIEAGSEKPVAKR